jgi:branched-chain amino acid transport system substrate-binding protein
MGRVTRRQLAGGAFGALALAASQSLGDGDSEAQWVTVGMSTALSGPAEALGTGMMTGVSAYFRVANLAGGVHGRSVRLVALDDAYEPGRCASNVRSLIDVSHVFAIVGNVGTPTAAVTVPIINEKRVPFFGAFTGAGLLRKSPPDRYVVNYRASYEQETEEMVRGIVQDLHIPPAALAFFTQDDGYGDSGFAGAAKALRAIGFDRPELLPRGRYPRNTSNIEGGLAKVLGPRVWPRAVIMVGTYAPCAKFIRLAKRNGLDAVFANVSFVGSDALSSELGRDGDGVVVTQVVPHYSSDLPLVREYRAAVADMNFVSLEGFIVGKAFVEALRQAGPGADRERFIETLEGGQPLDLGLGTACALSPAVHQLSNRVWSTCIRGGRFLPMTSWRQARQA